VILHELIRSIWSRMVLLVFPPWESPSRLRNSLRFLPTSTFRSPVERFCLQIDQDAARQAAIWDAYLPIGAVLRIQRFARLHEHSQVLGLYLVSCVIGNAAVRQACVAPPRIDEVRHFADTCVEHCGGSRLDHSIGSTTRHQVHCLPLSVVLNQAVHLAHVSSLPPACLFIARTLAKNECTVHKDFGDAFEPVWRQDFGDTFYSFLIV
jgi:hypothetical protein